MNFTEFVKTQGLTRTAKLVRKPVSTIQTWMNSGKTFIIKEDDSGNFNVWEKK